MKNLKGLFSLITVSFVIVFYSFILLISVEISESQLSKKYWWADFYNISLSLLSGALISFLFYYLVVKVPEIRKIDIIKKQFKRNFEDTKRSILRDVISASINGGRSDLSIDHETVERLMTAQGFEDAFKGGRLGHEGFYAFRNHMSGDDVLEYRDILISLHTLSGEIDFLLHNVEIEKEDMFLFFKRLQRYLIRVEKIGSGYEEEKELSNLIWDLYSQFCFIEGDLGYNRIQKSVDEL